MNREDRQNSVLAAGILIAALLLVIAVIVMPAFARRDEFGRQIEELQFQHDRFSKLVNQRDSIRKQLQQLRQRQTDTSGYLEDKPESLAAADLQNSIKNIIESKGGNLISTQIVQHESNTTFPDVRVRIQMRAGIGAIREILYALESGQPTLILDNVFLQKRNRRIVRRSTVRSQVQPEPELIEARFEVTGYIFHTQTESRS